MMRVHIRAAQATDMDIVTEIYGRSVVEDIASFELTPPDRDEMIRRWEFLQDGGFPYLVGTIDNEVAGFAYAGPYRPRKAYRHTVENTVYVSANHRKKGVAFALMQSLVEQCQQTGFKQMLGVIALEQEESINNSVKLHQKLGFSNQGRLRAVGQKFDRWLDVVFMQREL